MLQGVHLTVIDPGLMEVSGHHAGFAMFLAKSITREQGSTVDFFCHAEVNSDLRAALHQSGITTIPLFHSNFYEHYDDETNPASIKTYIGQLCREYIDALGQIRLEQAEASQVVFYPCLNWEHACALAMAMEHQKESAAHCPHVVCAMYNPGVDENMELLSRSRRLNFHLGFHALMKHARVSIFASDYELSQIYHNLLPDKGDIPVHPCYLADWQAPASKPDNTKSLRILIYLGDAKENKGFNALPELISRNLHLLSDNDRFVVQYTLSWDSPELDSTIEWLSAFSAQDTRLELHAEFWDDDSLVKQLAAARLVTFLYQADVYQSKSSGLLWLTAWNDSTIVLTAESWLSREASRLGRKILYMQEYDLQPILEKLNSENITSSKLTAEQDQYRNTLYRPFWSWINSIASTESQPVS